MEERTVAEASPGERGRLEAARLKDALIAAREVDDRRAAWLERIRPPARVRASADGALAGALAQAAGIDVTQWEAELATSRAAVRRHLQAAKADAVRGSGARAAELREGVAARRKALELVTAVPGELEHVWLDRPLVIWRSGVVDLEDSAIEPWNSHAKIMVSASWERHGWSGAYLEEDRPGTLSFFYFWENSTSGYVVVDVYGILLLNGYCEVGSSGGWAGGGEARLTLKGGLNLLGLPEPPLPEDGQTTQTLSFRADSTGLFSDDEYEHGLVYRGYVVEYDLLPVPPGGLVIEVSLAVDSGLLPTAHLTADFATGAFAVTSPFALVNVRPVPVVVS